MFEKEKVSFSLIFLFSRRTVFAVYILNLITPNARPLDVFALIFGNKIRT